MPNRPRVFISSTIYDFADLRSALRHYLSSLGYDPLLSEYNDFRAPVDKNSYDACAAAIGSCEYFILLIGSRVGGIYNQKEQISITRHEYQVAYNLLKNGRLKLFAFVRKSIWDIKEDRKSLVNHLKQDWQSSKELSDEQIASISKHSSPFINDADIIFSFIDEVTRKNEMRAAYRTSIPRPIGNWVFQFGDFSDIVDTLKAQMNINTSLAEAAALSNLRREILSNLQVLNDKFRTGIVPGHSWVDFLAGYNIDDFSGSSPIPSGKLVWLLIYLITGSSKSARLSDRYTHEIIRIGQLQKHDCQTGTLHQTPLGDAVLLMLDQIDRFKRIDAILDSQRAVLAARYRPLAHSKSKTEVPVPNEILFMIRSAHDRHQNIISLSKAIVRAIDGDESLLAKLQLQPASPSQRMAEELERETPSSTELENWINA